LGHLRGLKEETLALTHPNTTATSPCARDGMTISSASPGKQLDFLISESFPSQLSLSNAWDLGVLWS